MKRIFALTILGLMLAISPLKATTKLWQDRDRIRDRGTVGAPLDGGLLAILAAAGTGYVVARRKKRKGE